MHRKKIDFTKGDFRQSREWASYLMSIGWKVEKIGNNLVYIRSFPFIGSYIKIPRASWPIDFAALWKVSRKYRAFLIKVEPKVIETSERSQEINAMLKQLGFIHDFFTQTTAKTRIIDLKSDFQKGYDKDTRYSIRKAKEQGIAIQETQDIQLFYDVIKMNAVRKKFSTFSFRKLLALYSAFKKESNVVMLIAKKNSSVLAACMLLYEPKSKVTSYFMAGSIKNNLKASYALVDYALLLSKKKKFLYFDFEGFYDPRYHAMKRWQGFSNFKKGFGGEEVSFLGSFIKISNPVANFLSQIIFRIFTPRN